MTFAEFCSKKASAASRVTDEDAEAYYQSMRQARLDDLALLKKLAPELNITDDTLYYVVHLYGLDVGSISPADTDYIFDTVQGPMAKRMHLVVNDDDIYIIFRGIKKDNDKGYALAHRLAYKMLRRVQSISPESTIRMKGGY